MGSNFTFNKKYGFNNAWEHTECFTIIAQSEIVNIYLLSAKNHHRDFDVLEENLGESKINFFLTEDLLILNHTHFQMNLSVDTYWLARAMYPID